MVNFSFFPTAYWAVNAAQRQAIAWEKGNTDYFPFLSSSLNWAEFHHLVSQTANLLITKGVRAEQIIAYSGTHRLIGLLCYCSAMAIGSPILMLNPALSESQRQAILSTYQIDILIADQDFANFQQNQTAYLNSNWDIHRPATLTLTSGSSGMPKAVVHSAQNHLENAEGVCELMQFSQTDSWLLSLPLFHVSGQGIVWRWLAQGATLAVNEQKDHLFTCLDRVSHASLVPTQLQRYLQNKTEKIAYSQKFLLGGTAIPKALVAQAKRQGITCYSGYGMTEMASTICAVENELDNVGYPLKGREVKLVNGEIWVRGSGLALGYLQKNGEIRPLVNDEGWLPTKDRGEWNASGQLVVKGRLDNMFISGGENIQPEDVEKVIYQSGLVSQVFILPVEDAEFGERPVAIVQFLSHDFAKNCENLTAWLADKLEKFKQPIAYYPLEQLQLVQQGGIKISRVQLKNALTQLLGKYHDQTSV
ncbi:o-succinylbenzoate--CoA ligase [Actinobacillus equuli subsp. haemolyticus]|uniref:o-succinylbenzoate--CoA ligase n=1 Tax=Actinobacillus equuli TaxID=718 RepID=UPI0024467C7E|nr:o-succinylbenzoate--CoA ligase [Actinobacillus equuli]WGE51633.1 o-succinylbenzoate--CoA ligase [Actinobacillus equuli subsp. haemolyticus]